MADDVFVGDYDRRVCPTELEHCAAKGAAALNAAGIFADTPVAVIMRNDLAQIEVMRAAAFGN